MCLRGGVESACRNAASLNSFAISGGILSLSRIIDNSLAQNIGARKVYDPVGHCIYCLASNVPLSDEHTIPNGLGGRHILPAASCEKCQKIINVFEQYCMRTMFANTRAQLKIRSSKKRPEPKRSIRVRKRNGTIERVYKPISELPVITNLPVFPEPFALRGLAGPETFDGFQWTHGPAGEKMKKALEDFDAVGFLTEEIKPFHLARMLAKIAHSHAIAMLGEDSFEPWLPELILNENMSYPYWVGSELPIRPATPEHTMTIEFGVTNRSTDRTPLGVIYIRLFPNLGGPIYLVVIGKMLKPWP